MRLEMEAIKAAARRFAQSAKKNTDEMRDWGYKTADSVSEFSKAHFKKAESRYEWYENFYNGNRRFRMANTALSGLTYAFNVWETKKKDLDMERYKNSILNQFSRLNNTDVELLYEAEASKRDIEILFKADKKMSENYVELCDVVEEKADKLVLEKLAKEVENLKKAFLVKMPLAVPSAPGLADIRTEMRFQQSLMDSRRRELGLIH